MKVAKTNEIEPGQARLVDVQGKRIALFNIDGTFFALDNTCPLCKGTGKLSANQKSHWSAFAADHELEECAQCHEQLLVCSHGPRKNAHARKPRRG